MEWTPTDQANFDHAAFKKRLRDAIRAAGFQGWISFCEYAGLPPEGARQAIEDCVTNVWPYLDHIDQIASALGQDRSWLLTGQSTDNDYIRHLRDEKRQLVKEYIERDWVPEEHQERLHRYVQSLIDNLQARIPQAMYRRGLPETWRDVARIYKDLLLYEG